MTRLVAFVVASLLAGCSPHARLPRAIGRAPTERDGSVPESRASAPKLLDGTAIRIPAAGFDAHHVYWIHEPPLKMLDPPNITYQSTVHVADRTTLQARVLGVGETLRDATAFGSSIYAVDEDCAVHRYPYDTSAKPDTPVHLPHGCLEFRMSGGIFLFSSIRNGAALWRTFHGDGGPELFVRPADGAVHAMVADDSSLYFVSAHGNAATVRQLRFDEWRFFERPLAALYAGTRDIELAVDKRYLYVSDREPGLLVAIDLQSHEQRVLAHTRSAAGLTAARGGVIWAEDSGRIVFVHPASREPVTLWEGYPHARVLGSDEDAVVWRSRPSGEYGEDQLFLGEMPAGVSSR
jgi:hypothetical protein